MLSHLLSLHNNLQRDTADHATGISTQHPGFLRKGFKEEVSLGIAYRKKQGSFSQLLPVSHFTLVLPWRANCPVLSGFLIQSLRHLKEPEPLPHSVRLYSSAKTQRGPSMGGVLIREERRQRPSQYLGSVRRSKCYYHNTDTQITIMIQSYLMKTPHLLSKKRSGLPQLGNQYV